MCVAISPFSRNSGSPTGLMHLKRSLDHSAACLLLKLRSASSGGTKLLAPEVALQPEDDLSVCEEERG